MKRATRRKGQSAMEYLMTYGWAILIVIIVAAVLFSMGVFNPATYTTTAATGFSGFNVPAGGFKLDTTGALTMQITNGVGASISITTVTATKGAQTVTNTDVPIALGPGATETLDFAGFTGLATSSGTAYSVEIKITYTNVDTALTGFISSGTLTGTVS